MTYGGSKKTNMGEGVLIINFEWNSPHTHPPPHTNLWCARNPLFFDEMENILWSVGPYSIKTYSLEVPLKKAMWYPWDPNGIKTADSLA